MNATTTEPPGSDSASVPSATSESAIRGPLTPTKTFPIESIIGPTVYGKGSFIGTPCHVIQIPNLEPSFPQRSIMQICDDVTARAGHATLVVISGHSVALYELTELVTELRARGYYLVIETQGMRWRPWFATADLLAVTPKPQSTDDVTNWDRVDMFMAKARNVGIRVDLHAVVFDDFDIDYARRMFVRYPASNVRHHFITVETNKHTDTYDNVVFRLHELTRLTANDHVFTAVRILIDMRMASHIQY